MDFGSVIKSEQRTAGAQRRVGDEENFTDKVTFKWGLEAWVGFLMAGEENWALQLLRKINKTKATPSEICRTHLGKSTPKLETMFLKTPSL